MSEPSKEARELAQAARTLLRQTALLAPGQAAELCDLIARLNAVMKLEGGR
ncbi:MAG: hypothetical protein ACLGJC_09075 [Alphaproteobacteria bacterium]